MQNSDVLRKANVYVQNIKAGILCETDEGYSFTYDASYLAGSNPSVSITLPLRPEPYTSSVLFPFFDGLIPEGWLLNLVSRNWKIDRKDRFGLLLASCFDCIGDVSIRPEEYE